MIQGKLFTTENTKDTEKMILLVQDIKNFMLSATASCVALGNCSVHCSTFPIRAVVRVLRGECFDLR